MNSGLCKYDYFEKTNLNLKIVEDDYGNLKIVDNTTISEVHITDISRREVFRSSATAELGGGAKQKKKTSQFHRRLLAGSPKQFPSLQAPT
jgi:hypothetical protein